MDFLTCSLINGPLVVLNVAANAFYIFCMVCPLHGEKIKQPLKLLLWSLICCTIIFLMSAMLLSFSVLIANKWNFLRASCAVFDCSLSASAASSVWLNFFYYTQIVPARRALFIWIKKNIKPIIYCAWLVDKILSLLGVGVILTETFFDGFSYNFTTYQNTTYLQKPSPEFKTNLYAIATGILKASFIFFLCIMVMSSGSTVVYLCRHMRRMVANGQPLGPRFNSQVRVTVTGILQGVLYLFGAAWTVYKFVSQGILTMYSSPCIYFTVINVYMTGTMFNLGVGQAVFRQRAADIWLRAAQCCKAPKAQQSEQGG